MWNEAKRLQANKLLTDIKYAVLFSQFVPSQQRNTPQPFGKTVQLFIKEEVIFDQFDAGKTVEVRALTQDLQNTNILQNDIIVFRHKTKSILRKVLYSAEFDSIEIMFQTRQDIQPKDCLPNLGDAQKVIAYYYEKRYVSNKTRVVAFKLGLLTRPSGTHLTSTVASSTTVAVTVSVTPVAVTIPVTSVLTSGTQSTHSTCTQTTTTSLPTVAVTVAVNAVAVTIPAPVLTTNTVGASDKSVASLGVRLAVKTTVVPVTALTPVKPVAPVGLTTGPTLTTSASNSDFFTSYELLEGCPPWLMFDVPCWCLMCLAGKNCKDLRHVKTPEVDPSATSSSPIQEQPHKKYRTV